MSRRSSSRPRYDEDVAKLVLAVGLLVVFVPSFRDALSPLLAPITLVGLIGGGGYLGMKLLQHGTGQLNIVALARTVPVPTQTATTHTSPQQTTHPTSSFKPAVAAPIEPAAAATPPARVWPYTARETFFSRSEGDFYRALAEGVGERYLIFSKVRLLDICDLPRDEYVAFAKIAQKHVDFLLCDPATFEPLAAIEVDGSSHQRWDRVQRDKFVDEVFDTMELPLLRFAVRWRFDPSYIRRHVEEAIAAAQ